MGKRKKKIQSLRSYTTTSIASKNEELGIKSEREEAVSIQAEPRSTEPSVKREQELSNDKPEEAPSEAPSPTAPPTPPSTLKWDDDDWLATKGLQIADLTKKRVKRRKAKGGAASDDPYIQVDAKAEEEALKSLRALQLVDTLPENFWLQDPVTWPDDVELRIQKVWEKVDPLKAKTKLFATLIELEEYGFSHAQIKVAIERCAYYVDECVDWLILHLPELDLPSGWARGTSSGFVVGKNSSTCSGTEELPQVTVGLVETELTEVDANAVEEVDKVELQRDERPAMGEGDASDMVNLQQQQVDSKDESNLQQQVDSKDESNLKQQAELVDEVSIAKLKEKEQEEDDDELTRQKKLILQLAAMQQEEDALAEEEQAMTPLQAFRSVQQVLKKKMEFARLTTMRSEKKKLAVQIRDIRAELTSMKQQHKELQLLSIDDFPASDDEDGPRIRYVPIEPPSNEQAEENQANKQQGEEDGDNDDNDDEGLMGGLFEASDEPHPPQSESAESPYQVVDLQLDTSTSKRSKPNPSKLLEQHVKQQFGKRAPIRYTWDEVGPNKFQSTVEFHTFNFSMGDKCCTSQKIAREYVSLLALYNVASDYRYHLQLHISAQRLWIEWKEAELKEKEGNEREASIARVKIIKDLCGSRLEQATTPSSPSRATLLGQGSAFQDPDSMSTFHPAADSWENASLARSQSKQSTQGPNSKRGKDESKDQALQSFIADRLESEQYKKYLVERSSLPVMSMKESLLETLSVQDVVVISSATGSGKTTQLPQLILVDLLERGFGSQTNIVVTEPRRISAMSVAERVSQEIGDRTLGDGESLVGYRIRGDRKVGPNCRLAYETTGVLLRSLRSDPLLSEYSHILVDEVHERSVESDLLLNILKDTVRERRRAGDPLKVILMSATIDLSKLSIYFDNAPVLEAGGRSFPVVTFPLEDAIQLTGYICERGSEYCISRNRRRGDQDTYNDYDLSEDQYSTVALDSVANYDEAKVNFDLIEQILSLVHVAQTDRSVLSTPWKPVEMRFLEALSLLDSTDSSANAVLVFLPGLFEIDTLYARLSRHPIFADSSKFIVVRLHSSLSNQTEQRKAFEIPRPGVQKIILSTNIAETGVTIPDVCYVIDAGKVKQMEFNTKTGIEQLKNVFTSKASLKQRAGRAGRVRPGITFQLLSSHLQTSLPSFSKPEIQRVSLEGVVLQVLSMGKNDPWHFLSKALDAPPEKAIDAAVRNLEDIGALERVDTDPSDGMRGLLLTALGHHISQLPVNYKIAKMLILGALFQCLDPVLTIAATIGMEEQKLFLNTQHGNAAMLHKKFTHPYSDLLTYFLVYRAWSHELVVGGQDKASAFAKRFYLSHRSLKQIKRSKQELLEVLKGAGFASKGSRMDLFLDTRKTNSTTHKIKKSPGSSSFLSPPAFPEKDTLNKNSMNEPLVCSVLLAGLYPNLARPSVLGMKHLVHTCKGGERVVLISKSTNADMLSSTVKFNGTNGNAPAGILTFLTKMKTSKTMLWDSTFVPPIALLLFTNGALESAYEFQSVLLDWLKIHCAPRTIALLKKMRHAILEFLQGQFENPELSKSNATMHLMHAIVSMVKFDY